MLDVLNKLGDYEILEKFEEVLREKSPAASLGYFTGELERDPEGIVIRLRVAAMVDSAGEEDFSTNEDLKSIVVKFPEGDVDFRVEETVEVSGMEMEVVYRPVDESSVVSVEKEVAPVDKDFVRVQKDIVKLT
jgi:hypothetical protein